VSLQPLERAALSFKEEEKPMAETTKTEKTEQTETQQTVETRPLINVAVTPTATTEKKTETTTETKDDA